MKPFVFETMGTTASLTIADGAIAEGTIAENRTADLTMTAGDPQLVVRVIESFADFDQRFSLYRVDSELSAVSRGDLALTAASSQLRNSYAAAIGWRNNTGGAFTPHRPDGVIDLNGIVKALAMQAASDLLLSTGHLNWCLNVGGDVLCSGTQADAVAWSIGIVDPFDRSSLICALAIPADKPAMATSGIAERGEHIWTSAVARQIDDAARFVQVTVVAATIELADVLATAIIAGGQATLDLATANFAIDVFAICADGTMLSTPGFNVALAS